MYNDKTKQQSSDSGITSENSVSSEIPDNVQKKTKKVFSFFIFLTLIFLLVFAFFIYLKFYSNLFEKNQDNGILTEEKQVSDEKNVKKNFEPFIIGGIFPLTGKAESYGLPLKEATIAAKDAINQSGGINGRQIELILKDGECEKDTAEKAAKDLVENIRVDALIGGICSDEFLASAPIAQKNKIISFSPSATDSKISDIGNYVFRTCPSNESIGLALSQYVFNDLNGKNVGIITDESSNSLNIKAVVEEQFSVLGGKIIYNKSFSSETIDFSNYVNEINNEELDVIFVFLQNPISGVYLISSLKESGNSAQILVNDVFLSEPVIRESEGALEGVIGVESLITKNNSKTNALLEEYNSKGYVYSSYTAGIYDILYLIKEAYEKNDNSLDASSYLHNLSNWEGYVGVLSFDRNGDVELPFSVRKVVGDRSVHIKSISL